MGNRDHFGVNSLFVSSFSVDKRERSDGKEIPSSTPTFSTAGPAPLTARARARARPRPRRMGRGEGALATSQKCADKEESFALHARDASPTLIFH